MAEVVSPVYVLDTHALYWYWTDPGRLGPNADSVFRSLERRAAVGLVPLLVLAELHYLARRRATVFSVEAILRLIDRAAALRLEALTRRHLVAFGQLGSIPEMHDRFIAAVGLVHDAPIVTRDPDIQSSSMVRTIW